MERKLRPTIMLSWAIATGLAWFSSPLKADDYASELMPELCRRQKRFCGSLHELPIRNNEALVDWELIPLDLHRG